MESIFNIRNLSLCRPTEPDVHTAFSQHVLDIGDEHGEQSLPYNFILFVLDGEISVSCNEFTGQRFKAGEMAFLLRASMVSVKAIKETRMVVFYFDTFISACERYTFRTFLPDVEKRAYDFRPVPFPEPVRFFLEQLIYFQELHVDCMHFNEVKHRELFILIRQFCNRDEIIALLAPVINISRKFKSRVLEKYDKLETGRVSELASLVGMGRKNFDRRFREEFAISPAQWLQLRKAKRVKLFLMEPDITIADAIEKFQFNSPGHFNRFIRKHFGKTPGKLIKEMRGMKVNLELRV
jgi:AraC-like DNA-binding protein